MKTYMWCVLSVLVTLPAFAGPREREPVVYFDNLEGEITREGVEIRYQISRRQSAFLQNMQDGVTLAVSLFDERTGKEETFEAPLRYSDEVVVNTGGWRPRTSVRVWIFSKKQRQLFMGFGRVIARSIEPRLEIEPQDVSGWNAPPPSQPGVPPPQAPLPPPPPPTPVNWASQPEVIAACGRQFPFSDGQKQCLGIVQKSLTPPLPIIQACSGYSMNTETKLQCLRSTTTLTWAPAASIQACSEFFSNSAITECLGLLKYARFDCSATIDACRTSMSSTDRRIDCLRIALGAPSAR